MLPFQEALVLRAKIESAINDELTKARISFAVDMGQLNILPNSKLIIEVSSSPAKLSEALIGHYFSKAPENKSFAHYTNFSAFAEIIQSGEMRLHSLLKRLTQSEFTTFAKDHELLGYLEKRVDQSEPYYKTLARDLFYASFTEGFRSSEKVMWDEFGDRSFGVKLEFRLQTIKERSQLRRMYYPSGTKKAMTTIRALNDRLKRDFDRKLILRGTSWIGAFYLPPSFSDEEETRLLVKRWPSGRANELVVERDDCSYLPLPIGKENDFCRIDLINVTPGRNTKKEEVDSILRSNALFSHLAG